MKKALLLGLLMFGGAFFIAPSAHAADYQLDATVNSSTGANTFTDTSANNTVSGVPWGTLFNSHFTSHKGTYPAVGTILGTVDRATNWAGVSGTVYDVSPSGDSDYWISIAVASSSNTGYICAHYIGGAWSEYTCGVPPPAGDHPELTGVIRYNSPTVYATTTSPYTLDFDGIVNANASTTDGYKITYTSDSGCIRTRYGLLPSYTVGVPFNYSTTTDSLQDFCEGALRMTVEFGGGTEDTINYGTPWYGSGYALGIVFSYNTSEYSSTLNYSYTPPPFGGYASTSCALSLNPFAESNFQVAECAGYLFIPQSNQFSAYTSFKDTLMTKFPFSYFASAKGTWDSLQAGTANASPTYSFALHDAGIGSTTSIGNFLPNATVFSASTTKQYFPGNTFDLLKALASIAIWLTFIGYVFFHTRDILAKS